MTQTNIPAATPARFDVCAVGNAIVDVLAPCTPEFLSAQGLVPGSMSLVDEIQSAALYDAMAAGVEVSGGSAANTLAGIASLGGKGAYIGKVRADFPDAPPIWARSPTTPWARSSPMTSVPPAWPSTPRS